MSFVTRLVTALRQKRLDDDLDDELRFHVESRVEEYVAAGMSREEARRRARLQFGNPLTVRERSRDIKLLPWLESIVRDISFGARLYKRNPLGTLAAVLSLSLAIGACTAAFSLIEALILRPLPVRDPQSLVYVALRSPSDTRDGLSSNYPLFRRMREAGAPYVSLIATSDQRRQAASFDDSAVPDRVYGQWISGDAMDLLGVKPALGRLLGPSDDRQPGQHPVAVLSYEFWMRRFGGRADVLGRWVTIRARSLQIVGVAEKGFVGLQPGVRTDIWAPTMMWDDAAIADAGTRWFQIWGRLAHEGAREQAQAALQTVLTTFLHEQAALQPAESRERLQQVLNTRLYLRSAAHGTSSLREYFARPLWVLGATAALVLLIACANIAGLLVARTTSRAREMALRVAIGAGRARLIQQVLVESAMLALVACVLGAVFASLAAPAIVSMLSTSRTVVGLDLQVNWRMLLFLAVVGNVVTFVFGLTSALRASAVAPGDALKSGTGRVTGGMGVFRPLVATQVAFAFVVLFVANLGLISFVKLLRMDLGFDRSNLALARIVGATTADVSTSRATWRRLLERLEQAPGIESVSLSPWGLFEGSGRNKTVQIPGQSVDTYRPWYLPVSPGFLTTMGIPLVAGRDFDWSDSRPDVPSAVIVNESFVRRYYSGASPLGQKFVRVDGGAILVVQEIVGVAQDAKYTDIREPAPPTVYEVFQPAGFAVVQLRTRLDADALLRAIGDALSGSQSGLRVDDLTWQARLVDNMLVSDRVLATLSAFFSLVAMILVVVGLYGILSYSLVQRSQEFGIRVALGARPLRLIGVMCGDVGAMAIVGLVVGAVGAVYAAKYIRSLLFEINPAGFSAVAPPLVCLLVVCALSAIVPAIRLLRIDPTEALRRE